MCRFKILFLCFIFLTGSFFAPANYAAAADEGDYYSDDVPYLHDLEFVVHANNGEDRFAGDIFNLNKNINAFEFKIPIMEGIDYKEYYVVFDFTLKSQLKDGTITTHTYTEQIDISKEYSPGFFANLFINLGLKENAYSVYFNFGKLVSNSPDLIKIEKYIANASDNVPVLAYDYNTVVSRVDAYLVNKSSGEHGLIQRFDMTWNEDFYYSCCISINYCLYKPDTKDIINSGSISDSTGIYGYDSNGDNTAAVGKSVFAQLLTFLADIPSVLWACVTGVKRVSDVFQNLLCVLFPFLPGTAVGILCFIIYFAVLWGLYKVLRGSE